MNSCRDQISGIEKLPLDEVFLALILCLDRAAMQL